MRGTVPGLPTGFFSDQPRPVRGPHEAPLEVLHKRRHLGRGAEGRLRLGALRALVPQILRVLLVELGKVARVDEDQVVQHHLGDRLVGDIDHPALPPALHQ